MKLPIETQNKTAADDWVVLEVDDQTVAIPEGWLKGGNADRFDAVADLDFQTARKEADWVLGPGSHKGAMRDIDYLHAGVNDIYTLVDEGYVDGNKAILAFR